MSMKCEECNCVMQWRSTNKVTNLSKFKCPNCGHVQIGENKVTYHVGLPVEEKPKRVPKYYHCKDGRYIVKRRINKKLLYAGSYADEETAKKVVKELNECDWDLNMMEKIYEKLNITKVKRIWVCA